jgi:hypothetical protein
MSSDSDLEMPPLDPTLFSRSRNSLSSTQSLETPAKTPAKAPAQAPAKMRKSAAQVLPVNEKGKRGSNWSDADCLLLIEAVRHINEKQGSDNSKSSIQLLSDCRCRK